MDSGGTEKGAATDQNRPNGGLWRRWKWVQLWEQTKTETYSATVIHVCPTTKPCTGFFFAARFATTSKYSSCTYSSGSATNATAFRSYACGTDCSAIVLIERPRFTVPLAIPSTGKLTNAPTRSPVTVSCTTVQQYGYTGCIVEPSGRYQYSSTKHESDGSCTTSGSPIKASFHARSGHVAPAFTFRTRNG